jgi:ribosomal protein L7Ae-like RNA K-turn-binding protein
MAPSRTTDKQNNIKSSEKSRKSLQAQKRSPVKITNAVNTGAKVGRDIIVGPNSVSRLLEKNLAAVIAICRDSNHNLTDHIVEAAIIKHVPIIILPKSIEELASILKLKRISCFAVSIEPKMTMTIPELDDRKIAKSFTEAINVATDETLDSDNILNEDNDDEEKKIDEEIASAMVLSASMDDLRDALISLVPTHTR